MDGGIRIQMFVFSKVLVGYSMNQAVYFSGRVPIVNRLQLLYSCEELQLGFNSSDAFVQNIVQNIQVQFWLYFSLNDQIILKRGARGIWFGQRNSKARPPMAAARPCGCHFSRVKKHVYLAILERGAGSGVKQAAQDKPDQ